MDVVEDNDEGEDDLPMATQVVEESGQEGSEEENNEEADAQAEEDDNQEEQAESGDQEDENPAPEEENEVADDFVPNQEPINDAELENEDDDDEPEKEKSQSEGPAEAEEENNEVEAAQDGERELSQPAKIQSQSVKQSPVKNGSQHVENNAEAPQASQDAQPVSQNGNDEAQD